MLDSKYDYYVNFVPGFKYWDMCASEALIEAKMGICVDAAGKPLVYDEERDDFTVTEGIIIAKNMKVYNLVADRCKDNLGISLKDFYEDVQKGITERAAAKAAREEAKMAD